MASPSDPITVLVYTLITILLALVLFIQWKLTYWSRNGLPTLNPSIPWGDGQRLYWKQFSFAEQFQDYYNKFKAKGLRHGGIYIGIKPYYTVVDPEMIKNMLLRDFQYFRNHGDYVDTKKYPLSGQLFNLQDEKWKNMRIKLTAAFTSGKMKMMFETLTAFTDNLTTVLDEYVSCKRPVDLKEILSCFATDFVSSVGFGIESNSLKDQNSEFRKYGRKVFEVTWWDEISATLLSGLPHVIYSATSFKVTDQNVVNFFIKIVENIMTYREKNNVQRKDFMQLLLQLKNKGYIAENDQTVTATKERLELDELTPQAFVFFAAGFETTSVTMTFALFELAMNCDIQERLRSEIISILNMHNSELTYDGIKKMLYMDKVFCETLRKYPPVPVLLRQCSKKYTIPKSNVTIEKGINVVISITGVHHDSDYYPNPDIFDPERFSKENKDARPPFTYLPFGEGPRQCIGSQLGSLQSKVGIATLLKNYHISVNENMKIPVKFDTRSLITSVDDGVWLNLENIN